MRPFIILRASETLPTVAASFDTYADALQWLALRSFRHEDGTSTSPYVIYERKETRP